MIFFLDMDGVLNNVRVAKSQPEQYMHNNFGWIDPICIQFIVSAQENPVALAAG